MKSEYRIKLLKTLWFNTYTAHVATSYDEYIATLKIIPCMPLDRQEVPENAPEVPAYLNILVEEATFDNTTAMLRFEKKLADHLLHVFMSEDFAPTSCHFFYPSPPQLLDENLTDDDIVPLN